MLKITCKLKNMEIANKYLTYQHACPARMPAAVPACPACLLASLSSACQLSSSRSCLPCLLTCQRCPPCQPVRLPAISPPQPPLLACMPACLQQCLLALAAYLPACRLPASCPPPQLSLHAFMFAMPAYLPALSALPACPLASDPSFPATFACVHACLERNEKLHMSCLTAMPPKLVHATEKCDRSCCCCTDSYL